MKLSKLSSFLFPALLFLVNLQAYSQIQPCQATIGAINRTTPQIGFNTNAHLPANYPSSNYSGANWTQQWFIDSTAYIYPEILRYPGGTNANHWDWVTGWFRPGYQTGGPVVTTRFEEFKPGKIASNANGVYVVNMETSNANYEMNGLRHASAIGMNMNLFELGNEHNLKGDTVLTPLQFMTSQAYSQLAKKYYDSIKAVFPNSKICAVGGNNFQRPDWHDSVQKYVPTIEALAFHVYTNANNVDLVFNVNRALAVPFGSAANNLSLLYRYNTAGFSTLPASREVWVTEYNLWEQQISASPVIAETWTNFLYVTAMNHFFLSKSNITMMLNHSLASTVPYYYAISNLDKHITANGLAMKLLLDVSRGSQTCQSMNFSGNPSITYGTSVIPKLIGWNFNYSNYKKGFICNFSKDTFKVSIASVYSNPMQFNQFSADTNFMVRGLSSLRKYSGNSTDSILVYPFSFTQITSSPISNIQTQQTSIGNTQISVYRSQSDNDVTVHSNFTLQNVEVIVYNLLGQEVQRIQNISGQQIKISTNGLSHGVYIIKVNAGAQIATGKFVLY